MKQIYMSDFDHFPGSDHTLSHPQPERSNPLLNRQPIRLHESQNRRADS